MRFSKKLTFLSVLMAASCAASAATTGTLTITGNVVDQTCEVDAGQMTREVSLGDLSQGSIKGVAVDAAITSKDLVFDMTKCPSNVKSVGIAFNFTPDASHTGYLANAGKGKGVLLGITDESDALVKAGGVVLSKNLDTKAGTAKVTAKVKAFRTAATDADIVAGDVSSTATVTISQN
ncbi:TPA: type 1 fimbrial protein [Salmonella enterica]|nr:type 1 fimbrial protein [Salmonella enterica]